MKGAALPRCVTLGEPPLISEPYAGFRWSRTSFETKPEVTAAPTPSTALSSTWPRALGLWLPVYAEDLRALHSFLILTGGEHKPS